MLALFAVAALLSLRATTVPVYQPASFVVYLVVVFSLAPPTGTVTRTCGPSWRSTCWPC